MVWYGMMWYGMFFMHRKYVAYHTCVYSRLPEDKPSGSKHVDDIKN